MSVKIARMLALVALVAAIVGFGTPAIAQQYTGRIDVTVEDSTGGRLPGVTVDLTGQMIQSAVTDARGEAHFLNLTVGNYTVKAALTGLQRLARAPSLTVTAGGTIPLAVKMGVAGAKEEVVVTAEAPVLDTKKQTTATNVSFDELQNVPTARDPWVVMQSVPGIVMDRVNVGGSESGQQSGFMGKGASSGRHDVERGRHADHRHVLAVVAVLLRLRHVPGDERRRPAARTPKSATGGIQLNFMLKSGTNTFHGSGKVVLRGRESMQSNNMPDLHLAATASARATGKGDRTDQFTRLGRRHRRPDPQGQVVVLGRPTASRTSASLKLGGVPRPDRPAERLVQDAGRRSPSRCAGRSPSSRPTSRSGDATPARRVRRRRTLDQDGPNQMYKGEVNYIVGNNLFLVGRYAYVKGGFTFDPRGRHGHGRRTGRRRRVARLVRQLHHRPARRTRSWWTATTSRGTTRSSSGSPGGRPRPTARRPRPVTTTASTTASRASDRATAGAYPYLVRAGVRARTASDGPVEVLNFYVGDTITLKRMTINLGLRFDHQVASVLPSPSRRRCPGCREVPAGESRRRASTTRSSTSCSSRASASPTRSTRPARRSCAPPTRCSRRRSAPARRGSCRWPSTGILRRRASTANRRPDRQPNEILLEHRTRRTSPTATTAASTRTTRPPSATSINKVGRLRQPEDARVHRRHRPRADAEPRRQRVVHLPHDRGLELAADHAVRRQAAHRRHRRRRLRQFKGTSPAHLPTGIRRVDRRHLQRAVLRPHRQASPATRRRARSTRRARTTTRPYQGFEVTATKRMSNHWMARFGFSTNCWREYFDGARRLQQPDADARQPEHRRRLRRVGGRRFGQERHLHGAAEVPDHRQRRLPVPVRHRPRRQLPDPPGLPDAVVPEHDDRRQDCARPCWRSDARRILLVYPDFGRPVCRRSRRSTSASARR